MQSISFDKEYILENDIVQLRPLVIEDLKHLEVFALNEPTLWQYSLIPANGIDKMTNYINAAISDRKNETSYPFIVYDKTNKEYAGSTRFYDYQAYHKTVQLGYTWYGKKFQGTKINKNCKFLMLQFAFEKLELERVEFRADNLNERSVAAMKSIGCKVEGVLRNNCTSETGRRDSIILSILKEEWFEKVKSSLLNKL